MAAPYHPVYPIAAAPPLPGASTPPPPPPPPPGSAAPLTPPPPPPGAVVATEEAEHARVRDTYACIDRRQREEMLRHRSVLDGTLHMQAEAAFREHSSRARLSSAQLQVQMAAQRTQTWEEETASVAARAKEQQIEHQRAVREVQAAERRQAEDQARAADADRKHHRAAHRLARERARVARLEAATSVGKLVLDTATFTEQATHAELSHAKGHVDDIHTSARVAKQKYSHASEESEKAYNRIVESQRELRCATAEVSTAGGEVADASGKCRSAELHHSASLQHVHNVAAYLRHVDPVGSPVRFPVTGPAHLDAARADLLDAQMSEQSARMTMRDSAQRAQAAGQRLMSAEQQLSSTAQEVRAADSTLQDVSLVKARTALQVREKSAVLRSAKQRTEHMQTASQHAKEQRAQSAADLARRRASLKRAKDRLNSATKFNTSAAKETERQLHAADTARRMLSLTLQREEEARREAEARLSDARVAAMRHRASSQEAEWAEQQCELANRDFIDAATARMRQVDDTERTARALAVLERDNAALQRERVVHEMSPRRAAPGAAALHIGTTA